MQKDKVTVHCAEASVDEGQEAGNTGGAAANACTTGPLERIADALEELVYVIKEKKNLPPTPPIRQKETCDDPTARARRKFIKPTVEELAAYIAEKGYAFDARRRLVESGLKHLLPVLEQVVKNGKNRKESICNLATIWRVKKEIARRRYYRGVQALLSLFQPIK